MSIGLISVTFHQLHVKSKSFASFAQVMVKSCVNVQVMVSLVQVTSKSRASFEQVMFKLSASHFKVIQVKNFQVFVMKCSNCLSCQFFSSSGRLKDFSVLFNLIWEILRKCV